jgi:hypothetical protein
MRKFRLPTEAQLAELRPQITDIGNRYAWPNILTAREAVAWTFGMGELKYYPKRET